MKKKLPVTESIAEKIRQIHLVAEDIPGILIIHNIQTTEVVYMSPNGLRLLGTTLAQLQAMGQDYHNTYFNVDESKEYVPKIFGLLERNVPGEIVTFFQQVNLRSQNCWKWHCSSVKILLRDDDGKPVLIITHAATINPTDDLSIKADRLLKENEFLRTHQKKFNLLTRQEQKVLKYLATGMSSAKIAAKLHISLHTADTHRRNIKKKLAAGNLSALIEYARAFNLV